MQSHIQHKLRSFLKSPSFLTVQNSVLIKVLWIDGLCVVCVNINIRHRLSSPNIHTVAPPLVSRAHFLLLSSSHSDIVNLFPPLPPPHRPPSPPGHPVGPPGMEKNPGGVTLGPVVPILHTMDCTPSPAPAERKPWRRDLLSLCKI